MPDFTVSNVRCFQPDNSAVPFCCDQHKRDITQNFQGFFNQIIQNSDFRSQMSTHQLDIKRDTIRWHITIVPSAQGAANTYSVAATKLRPDGTDENAYQFAPIPQGVADKCTELFQGINHILANRCPHPTPQVQNVAAPAAQPVQAAPQAVVGGGAPTVANGANVPVTPLAAPNTNTPPGQRTSPPPTQQPRREDRALRPRTRRPRETSGGAQERHRGSRRRPARQGGDLSDASAHSSGQRTRRRTPRLIPDTESDAG